MLICGFKITSKKVPPCSGLRGQPENGAVDGGHSELLRAARRAWSGVACGRLHLIEFQTDTSCQGAASLVSADHFGMKPNGNNGALFSE